MDADFLGQPFSERDRLGPLLVQALEGADSFWAITAWAQLSGLAPLSSAIRALRARGGSASLILGLDGGIATREALELSVELFSSAHVFHDTGSRLFHPKLYCVESGDTAVVVIGSSNFTSGGLFRNYEANVALRLRLDDDGDVDFLEQLQAFRDRIIDGEMPCELITPDLITRLDNEESLLASAAKREEQKRLREGRADSLARQIFGEPVGGLPGVPPAQGDTHRARTRGARGGSRRASAAPPVQRWWKQLTASDVLRKPETSHQRNYVALSKAGHDIDFKTWFRESLFGSADWMEEQMRTGNLKEIADISFDVYVEDQRLGEYVVRVDHAETRIANQNNSPTYLNWSSLLDVIRASDFRGWWLELARLSDGSFRLRLLRDEPLS